MKSHEQQELTLLQVRERDIRCILEQLFISFRWLPVVVFPRSPRCLRGGVRTESIGCLCPGIVPLLGLHQGE